VRSLKRALLLIGVAGVVWGLVCVGIILSSDHWSAPWAQATITVAVGWSFLGTGLFAWWRRPDNRVGAVMTIVGETWFLGALSAANQPGWHTAGHIAGSIYIAAFIHMLLIYPSGRFEARWQRTLIVCGYVLAVLGPLPWQLFERTPDCSNCPRSALFVSDDGTLLALGSGAVTLAAIGLVAAAGWALWRRWRAATPPQRRALAPVLWAGSVLLVVLPGSLLSETAGASPAVHGAIGLIATAALLLTPYLFLFTLLRSRWARAGAVSELLGQIGAEPSARDRLRDVLADALGDPSLRVAYWLQGRERWVDEHGEPMTLPAEWEPKLAWTAVELDGRRVGAIVHDAQLCEDPDLLRSVAAAAALALEHGRLQAELHARVADLRRSRARLIEVAIAERRSLERNLHDGAQQRLVALSLTLRLAQARLERDPQEARVLLASASDELARALEELRELARGIHPAVLSDRGLRAALETLAGRSPVRVELVDTPEDRLPAPVEAAAYYVIAEALTNVARYAHATQATVRVRRRDGKAVVEVADDGIGGADPQRGSGLRGLSDRLAALDGRLAIESPPGAGTRLVAEIPVS
jgi:signal transduction histidine kinase